MGMVHRHCLQIYPKITSRQKSKCVKIILYTISWWLGGVMVTASDLHSTGRGFDSRTFHYQVATLGKLLTPMCLCHQAVHFGTGQRAVMLCGREGNRRSGVALAMHHRLLWFIHLRAQRPPRGRWAPHLRSYWGMVHFITNCSCNTDWQMESNCQQDKLQLQLVIKWTIPQ